MDKMVKRGRLSIHLQKASQLSKEWGEGQLGKSEIASMSFKKIFLNLYLKALDWIVEVYNFFHRLKGRAKVRACSDFPLFRDIEVRASMPSDISEHLKRIFIECEAKKPKLIVELGTRGGESAFVFERIAALTKGVLVSVDLNDCSAACRYIKWKFVQSDDIEFAMIFREYCQKEGIQPDIDVLFVDTSHEYSHTKDEIRYWFPFLSPFALVIFHDTNMKIFYRRCDGSLGRGWSNRRGVIRAIEEYLECKFDEDNDFIASQSPWIIKHWANSSGLTILERRPDIYLSSP
jgi:cephalosporin hydroxylase